MRALGARVRDARLAQHAEVVRAGRLGDPEVERPAGALAGRGQLAHDLDAHRVAEGGHHGRQRHLFEMRLVGVHGSTVIVLRDTRRRSMFEDRRTSDLLPSLTAALAWGAMFPIAATAIQHVDAFHLTAVRYLVATRHLPRPARADRGPPRPAPPGPRARAVHPRHARLRRLQPPHLPRARAHAPAGRVADRRHLPAADGVRRLAHHPPEADEGHGRRDGSWPCSASCS